MARLRKFVGCFFLAKVDENGNTISKWETPGEAYPLSLTFSEEPVKIMGNTCVTEGKVIGSYNKPGEVGGSLVMLDYSDKNVARALKGLITTRNISSTTITAQAVVLGKFGEFSEIGKEDLSDVVVKDATDTTTYVLNTDYTLEPTLGLIAPISGGGIAEDATVHVSATCAANTDQRVAIGSGATEKYAIKGKMIDKFTGKTAKLFLRSVLFVSKKEVVLASGTGTEHESLEFDLVPEVPTGQSDYGYIDGLPV